MCIFIIDKMCGILPNLFINHLCRGMKPHPRKRIFQVEVLKKKKPKYLQYGIDPEKPPLGILCNICNIMMRDPSTTPCCTTNHCTQCIKKYIVSSKNKCPTCHNRLFVKDLTKNDNLKQV